ncbi:helix-turn-helix domain-containing protein [Quadrisphaera sp. KR29]|uniref:helix-turn-helix domain-containing protein n=1 Tax=Quadrisphaera sp. KR29 TaxID=3461391 RepID=UPI0040448081
MPAPTPWPVLQEAARLREAGLTDAQVAHQLGICVNTIRRWRRRIRREDLVEAPGRTGSAACPRCESGRVDEAAYAHLLGWYLGDGHIALARGAPRLLTI